MFGWKWKYPTHVWHTHSIDKYPGWEIESEGAPAFAKMIAERDRFLRWAESESARESARKGEAPER